MKCWDENQYLYAIELCMGKYDQRRITVKNHLISTKFEFDSYFLVKYLHLQFQSYSYITKKIREWQLKISYFFSKFKRDSSVKNHWNMTKFEHDLHIPKTYLHICNFNLLHTSKQKIKGGNLKCSQEG
jgi:hypothetical protein